MNCQFINMPTGICMKNLQHFQPKYQKWSDGQYDKKISQLMSLNKLYIRLKMHKQQ